MRAHRGFQSLASATVGLVLLLSLALALVACGGSGEGDVGSTAVSSAPASSPSSAAPVEFLSAYTQAASRIREPGELERLIALYAEDACMEDRAFGATAKGTDEIRAYWERFFLSGLVSYRTVATYLGRDCAVIECDAYAPDVMLPSIEVLMLRDGRIRAEYVYYCDGQKGRTTTPLKTQLGPRDSAAVALRTAKAYLSALRALDAGALGSLYTDKVVYWDTADKRRFVGASAASHAHAKMFAMKGVGFSGAGVLSGRGWAVVMWRRTDREGRQIPFPEAMPDEFLALAKRPTIAGATMLEIRDGKIARETIYCDHLRTRL
jgi:ketosteroid isomerase-like protein